VARAELTISPDVAFQLLNRKRGDLVNLEERYQKPVMVRVNGSGAIDYIELAAFDDRGGTVDTELIGTSGAPLLESIDDLHPSELFGSDEIEPVVAAGAGSPTEPGKDSTVEPGPVSELERGKTSDSAADVKPATEASEQPAGDDEGRPRHRRRRRSSAKRSSNKAPATEATADDAKLPAESGKDSANEPGPASDPGLGKTSDPAADVKPATEASEQPAGDDDGRPRRRRRRRTSSKRSSNKAPTTEATADNAKAARGNVKTDQANAEPAKEPMQGAASRGAKVSRGYSNTLEPPKDA